MKKRLVFSLLLVFALSLLFFNLASAKIIITAPNQIYNLGDKFYTTITLIPTTISGFFQINLVCNNQTNNLYKVPAEPSFSLGEEQTVSTSVILIPEYIGSSVGMCSIVSSIGTEQVATKQFEISNKIIVKASLDKTIYNPGETITLNLEATKANGVPLQGFLEASGAATFSKAVENGLVREQFTMPETIEAGAYNLNLFVYDRGINNTLNQENTSVSFQINQIPYSIQLSLSMLEVSPEEELTIGADIFDQAGLQMPGIVSLTLVSPLSQEKSFSVNSGESTSIAFALNETPGTWKIYATHLNINEQKEFTIKEIQKVSFEFEDSILIIKNIGNSVYNKTIEINIGNEVKKLELNIPIGKERRFNLKAPNGEYNVIVTDQENTAEKTILLTGDVISISDFRSASLFNKFPIVWIFLTLVLGATVMVFFFRFRSKEFKIGDKIKNISSKFSEKRQENQEKEMIDISKPQISQAESTLVLKGQKNRSSIVAIKINNYSQLKENAKKELREVLDIARNKRGMVDSKEENILIVFSPLITKTFSNEILSVKASFEILKRLQEYNKKSIDKIEFNIGINAGDLIANIEDKKLKYTSIDNTILIAKRIADSSNNKLLVTDSIKNKLIRDLKLERAGKVGSIDVFSVLTLQDREANREKLQDLLNRMKNE